MSLPVCPRCNGIYVCYCGYIAMLSRDPPRLADALDAHAKPWAEHPPGCPCPPHAVARLQQDPLDLDPFRRPKEHCMPTKTAAPADLRPCRICGISTEMPRLPEKSAEEKRRDREDFGPAQPTLLGPSYWPTCSACSAVMDEAETDARARVGFMAELLGLSLSADDPAAQVAAVELPTAMFTDGVGAWSTDGQRIPKGWGSPNAHRGEPTRWQHVTDEQRDRLRTRLQEERDRRRPRRCVLGPCAGCGRRKATGEWVTGPTATGARGRRAVRWAVCAECWDAADLRDGLDSDSFGQYVTKMVFGLSTINMLTPIGKPYCRVWAGLPVDAPGVDVPWTYYTPEKRRSLQMKHPALAPKDHQERLAKIAAVRAAREARQREAGPVRL